MQITLYRSQPHPSKAMEVTPVAPSPASPPAKARPKASEGKAGRKYNLSPPPTRSPPDIPTASFSAGAPSIPPPPQEPLPELPNSLWVLLKQGFFGTLQLFYLYNFYFCFFNGMMLENKCVHSMSCGKNITVSRGNMDLRT